MRAQRVSRGFHRLCVLVLVAFDLLCASNTAQAARCPDKPGLPIPDCPERPFPPGVATADKAWFHCLFSSMAVQMKRFADLNQAAEAAFGACQTEEQGLRAALMAESHFTPEEAATLIGYLKPKAKQRLIQEGSW
jgi:hypothetical protein